MLRSSSVKLFFFWLDLAVGLSVQSRRDACATSRGHLLPEKEKEPKQLYRDIFMCNLVPLVFVKAEILTFKRMEMA